MLLKYLIIVLAVYAKCNCERVIVELADGGKSRPLVIKPLEHNHEYESREEQAQSSSVAKADALSVDSPDGTSDRDDENSDAQNGENVKRDIESNGAKDTAEMLQRDEPLDEPSVVSDTEEVLNADEKQTADLSDVINEDLPKEADEITKTTSPDLQTDKLTEATPLETPAPVSTTMLVPTPSPTPMVTTLPPRTSMPPTTAPFTTTPTLPIPTPPTPKPPPIQPCHNKCSEALNATVLYSEQKTLISQGADLTLTCELPLDASSFILEDLIWLYHPENSPTHQCSLTTMEFLPSCQGFHTIQDTDDRNDTFKRESITLKNMQANYSGQYMCQIKITCCHASHQHVMGQEHIVDIKVRVWLADYTLDLAIAGSITAALAIIVLGGSFCILRRQKAHYTSITDDIQEIKPCTVLHIPLVEDNDNDSFDSDSDDEQ